MTRCYIRLTLVNINSQISILSTINSQISMLCASRTATVSTRTVTLAACLYAKWGSGKSDLLKKMKESMHSFSRSWLDGVQLSWSWSLVLSIGIFVAFLTFFFVTAISAFQNYYYIISVSAVGFFLFVLLVFSYGLIYYGSEVKSWDSCTVAARSIAKGLARARLLLSITLQHAASVHDKDISSCPVSFLFADYHRLSSIGGEQALAKIVVTLFEAAENHFGSLPVRFFCALRVSFVYCSTWKQTTNAPGLWYSGDRAVCVVLILTHLKLIFSGFMALYWNELRFKVDLLADMVRSLDIFTKSQTRLVVVVDGLDNCEQVLLIADVDERMVQTLDAIELLFTTRADRPFVVTIAVDPHIIISAVNHSMHSALTGTELTGHDYLKNIVNMPFYLHNSAIRQLQTNLHNKRESLAEWKERFKRQDTFHGKFIIILLLKT
ncbi:unnamed protein product, partial [Gongylonema pulchrum]|uniref:KAP NTPase domain-containing protein n=1 Tax=Gongylonema pulchrum TaxID=637853 RepID=A0A183E2T9_9BILA